MAVEKAKCVERLRTLTYCVLALLVAASIGVLAATKPAHAARTFTVNYTGDSADQKPGDGKCFTGQNIVFVGPACTLRAAIQEANKFPGADTIAFNIPTIGATTISPATALPTITQRVTIDGYTQSGATKNTLTEPGKTDASPKIELDGTNAGVNVSGLEIKTSNVVVRGLVINSFSLVGIRSSGGTGNRIEGNFIGTDPGVTLDQGNGLYGVYFDNTDGSTIGGTSHEARNLISGNGSGVVMANGSSGNRLQGNLIGTTKAGTADLGEDGWGVFISSSSHNNIIGDPDPTDGLTNAANTIAFHSLDGVIMNPGNTGNHILSNSIHSNGQLGMNLFGGTQDANGVTANDPKDPDTGANRLQNYPLLTSAVIFDDPLTTDDTTTIAGDLNSTPSTRKKKRIFIIQFFSNPAADAPSGYGEGKTFLGQIQVKTDRQGNAFDFSFATRAVSEGEWITATATNKATGDTSEFSAANDVDPVVITPG